MRVKYATAFARLIVQIQLYQLIREDSPTFRTLCPAPESIFTVQQPQTGNNNLNLRLVLLCFLPTILHFYKSIHGARFLQDVLNICEKLYFRLGLVFVLKLFSTIPYDRGLIQTIKCIFFQILLIFDGLGIDFFNFYGVEAAEILITDLFSMLLYIYQVQNRFCFKYGLFFYPANMAVACVSMIEGFYLYKPTQPASANSSKVPTVFTRQDGYRLMMMTCLTFVGFAIGRIALRAQQSVLFNYGVAALAVIGLQIYAMRQFKKNLYGQALALMLGFLGTGMLLLKYVL